MSGPENKEASDAYSGGHRPSGLLDSVAALANALGVGQPSARKVELTEAGRMRQDGGSRWMDFDARQTISTVDCTFSRSARSRFARAIEIRDALAPKGGELRIRALGLILVASVRPSPELTRGELIRYLAEIPWAPQAIVANSSLRWTQRSDGRLSVAASTSTAVAEVTFTLDERARIAEVYCADRPRAVKDGFQPTPGAVVSPTTAGARASGFRLPDRSAGSWRDWKRPSGRVGS